MSIWNKYPELSGNELRVLVAITAQELLESQAASEFSEDLLETSPAVASRELLPLLQETDPSINEQQIRQLLENPSLSRQLCIQVLGEVSKYPELSKRIADAYDREARMMDGGLTLLLVVGGLVILAMKIKEIHLSEEKDEKGSKKETKISFYEAGDAVKAFITSLIKGPR